MSISARFLSSVLTLCALVLVVPAALPAQDDEGPAQDDEGPAQDDEGPAQGNEGPAQGNEGDADDYSGSFLLGWRFVDVGGAETKYRQHLNLEEGAVLYNADFDYRPKASFADEVKLSIDALGNEPFESIDFSMRKYGNYKFALGRRKSAYFYNDLILPPELGNPSLSNAGDFHTFDFDRVRDFANFELTLNRRARLDFNFDRFSKEGESTTTLDLQRDEFELDRPIDENMDQFGVAFQYGWDKATLVLRETYRIYENFSEIFLPGQSPGENPTNATVLDFYFLDQPTDFKSNQHDAQVNLRPTERLILRFSASLQNLDLDVAADERSKGIAFNGQPFTTDLSGEGEVSRDLELFDFDASFLITDRIALVGGIRQHHLDQAGELLFGPDLGKSDWDIETTSGELGVELAVTSDLTLGVGVRDETRDTDFIVGEGAGADPETESTDHTGYYLTVGWEPLETLRVTGEYEDSSYDDPFTLSSPTDRERLRLQAQLNMKNGFFANGIYLFQDIENTNSVWNADYDSLTLRGGYRRNGLEVSAGYAFVDVQRNVDQLVSFGTTRRLVPVFFESNADFIDGRVYWHATERLAIGGDFRFYDNEGDFATDRDDFRAWLDIDVTEHYLAHVAYRTVDYQEPLRGRNNYDADIVEVGVGYRF